MELLISLILVMISQYICISEHHIVHLKYLQFSFVIYTIINLEKKRKHTKVQHNTYTNDKEKSLQMVREKNMLHTEV